MSRSFKKSLVMVSAMLCTVFSFSPVWADDTEIFFGGSGTGGATANVLFVIDTSGSMSKDDDDNGTSRMDDLKTAFKSVLSEVKNVNVGMMRFSNPGGPVLYPVKPIDSAPTTASSGIVTSTVSSGSDDGFEYNSAHGVVLNSTRLAMGQDDVSGVTINSATTAITSSNNDAGYWFSSSTAPTPGMSCSGGTNDRSSDYLYAPSDRDAGSRQYISGVRFTSVSVPRNATIVRAYLQVEVGQTGDTAGPLAVSVVGEKASDTTAANGNFNDSARTPCSRLAATSNLVPTVSGAVSPVSWQITDLPAVDDVIRSPDLTTILQPMVNDSSWGTTSGTAVLLLYKTAGAANAWLGFSSFDRNNSIPPKLVVEYYTGSASAASVTTALRFQNVNIPKGVTVTNATLTFNAQEKDAASDNVTIYAEKQGNSAALTTTASNISSRTKTSAGISWSIPTWASGGQYDSPNISTVVQEVVGSSSTWCGGNSMTFLITGSAGRRLASAYEDGSVYAPKLTIQYLPSSVPTSGGCNKRQATSQISSGTDDAEESSTGTMILTDSRMEMVARRVSGTDTAQKVGFRFTNVQIPQGATIRNAYMQFVANNSGNNTPAGASGGVALTITGQNADSASTFASTSGNISSTTVRPKTSQSVAWSLSSSATWTTDQIYNSPDITSIVQAIINRSGWNAGNAMALFVTGTDTVNHRRASGYERNSTQAARLIIEYNDTTGTAGYTVRDELISAIDQLNPNGYTPIQDVMYEAANYYRGGPVLYGARRGGAPYTAPTTTDDGGPFAFTRVSHPDSYTGGAVVRSGSCTDADLGAGACASEVITGSPTYISPITASCQSNHIVLLTDGLANRNHSDSLVKSMIGASSCSTTGGEACVRELTAWLYNQDNSSTVSDTNRIITDTIAFNLSDTSFLQTLADNTHGHGTFLTATNASTLADKLNQIFTSVLNTNSTFVSAGTAVNAFNRTLNRDELYFSVFRPESTPRWSGNLKKYKLAAPPSLAILDANDANAVDPSTGFFLSTTKSFWSPSADGNDVTKGGTASQFPNYASRKIYTYLDDVSGVPSDLSASLSSVPVNQVISTNSYLTAARFNYTAAPPATLADLIDWTRGKDLADEDGDTVTNENRFMMADPLHSRPVAVTYKGTAASPDMTIFVGTNSGFLHAFDNSSGQEVFSFIPREMLLKQMDLYNNSSATPHVYGLDGPIVPWVVDPDNDGIVLNSGGTVQTGNHVYLYVAMRRGGRNYYALDVVDRAHPKMLWQIKGGTTTGFNNLGETWAQPLRAQIRINNVAHKVLIISGGYDANQDISTKRDTLATDTMGNAIYIVDYDTGALVWSGSSATGSTKVFTDMKYSIPAGVTGADVSGDGLLDFFYVGDTGGQVWRFDINNATTTAAGLINGGVIADLNAGLATPTAANNRRFYHSPALFVGLNGSAPYLGVSIGSGWRAHPLNTDTEDKFYVIRQGDIFSAPATYTKLYESDLYDATDNMIGQGTSSQQTTAQSSLSAAQGWFINMENDGEKVLSTPLIAEGLLYFDTYQPGTPPTSNPCQPTTGINRSYEIHAFDATPTANHNTASGLDKGDRSIVIAAAGIIDQQRQIIRQGADGQIISVGVEGTGTKNLPSDMYKKVHRINWYENR